MSEQGCTYREHEGHALCNKLCDPNRVMCPFHLMLTEEHEREKDRRQKARSLEAARLKKARGRR